MLAAQRNRGTYDTNCDPITHTGSAGLADTDPPTRLREQAVDEVLQLWIYKAIVDRNYAPKNGTIILATGDGKPGEFNKDGYIGCVRSALKKGWRVELYSWNYKLSKLWSDQIFDNQRLFSIHTLDEFIDLSML